MSDPKVWRYSEVRDLVRDALDARVDEYSNNTGITAVRLTWVKTGRVRTFERDGNYFLEVTR